MNTLQNRRHERLSIKLNQLQTELGKKIGNYSESEIDILVDEIRTLEAEIKQDQKIKQLETVNRQQKEHRDFLKDVLSLEIPKEDITTNSGDFHAVKIKKYPQILAFQKKYEYARLNWDYKANCFNEVDYRGKKYTILKPGCISSEVNYSPWESLQSCLEWHGFLIKPMTLKQFLNKEAAIIKESNRIKSEIEKANEKMKKLDVHFLERNNLIKKDSYNRGQTYYSI